METAQLSYISIGRAPVLANSNALPSTMTPALAHEEIDDRPDSALLSGSSYSRGLRIKELGDQALEKSSKWTES